MFLDKVDSLLHLNASILPVLSTKVQCFRASWKSFSTSSSYLSSSVVCAIHSVFAPNNGEYFSVTGLDPDGSYSFNAKYSTAVDTESLSGVMSQCEVRSLIVGGGYIDNLLAVWARRFME